MCSCPWKSSSNGWFMRTALWIISVRLISSMRKSRKNEPLAGFMPRFSTNKQSYRASNRSHAHLIRLHSTIYGEVSQPPLLWISNCAWIRLESIVAAATIDIMMLPWVVYLGALSRINAILIPQILAHPQSWPNERCTAHGPSFARVWYILTRSYKCKGGICEIGMMAVALALWLDVIFV